MAPYARVAVYSVLQRQINADVAIPEVSKNSTSDWSAQLVATAEKSWSVSGTSVLSAWGLALVGSVSLPTAQHGQTLISAGTIRSLLRLATA